MVSFSRAEGYENTGNAVGIPLEASLSGHPSSELKDMKTKNLLQAFIYFKPFRVSFLRAKG